MEARIEKVKDKLKIIIERKNKYAEEKIKCTSNNYNTGSNLEYFRKVQKEVLANVTDVISELNSIVKELGINEGKQVEEIIFTKLNIINTSVKSIKEELIFLFESTPERLKQKMKEMKEVKEKK
jgi:hypothetical protein